MPQAITEVAMLIITTLVATTVRSRSIGWMNGGWLGRSVQNSRTRR
jgi:cobalamin synthase